MRTTLRSKVTLLFIVCAVLIAIPGAAALAQDTGTSPAPTIQSDKADYAPGELVTLTGSGWQPGESVHINVNDTFEASWSRNVDVIADASGSITDSFNLPDWFVSDYDVTATGAQSGTARTTFTDSLPQGVAVSPASRTVTQGDSTTYTVNVDMAGNGDSCTVTLSAVGLPSGASATFTNNPRTGGPTDYTSTMTVTTTAATPAGAHTLSVNATKPPGCNGNSTVVISSNQVTLNVNSAARATTTTLARTAGTSPSTYGDSLAFTATVNSSAGSPTAGQGTVTFKDGTNAISGCSNVALNGSSQATCTTSTLNVAGSPHSITAEYSGVSSGSPLFQASTSNALSQTVNPKSLTGSFTADNKQYDGNNSATVLTRSLSGIVGSDVVTLNGGTATFDNKNAGTGKTVTLAGATLGGANAGNYTLGSVSTTTANITAKALTINGAVANDKPYDGNTNATVNFSGASLAGGVVTGDTVTINSSGYSANFDNANVGTNKAVTVTGVTLGGMDAGNYTVSQPSGLTANITPKALTGSFTAKDKVYDGNTNAEVDTTSLPGVIGTDDVSLQVTNVHFSDKNVGTGKDVTGDLSLSGNDADNYSLSSNTATTTADITKRDLTVSATGVNKVYDGNTDATVTLSTNKVNGDDVTAAYTSASFANKNAGPGKTVSVNGISISGADAGNYNLTNNTASTTATIAPRPITVTAEDKSKLFGDPDPALTYQVSGGPLVSGDSFTGSLSRDPGEVVGQYNILQGTVKVSDGNNGDNYLITYNGAKLTIGAWTFKGFYQPVDMSTATTTVWNTAKGGSTVPLKFELFKGSNELTDTANIKPVQYTKVSCSTGTGVEDAIETVATGGTSLRYDTTGGQFIYNWKTPTGAGSCYKATVTAQDGSTISAYFKMK